MEEVILKLITYGGNARGKAIMALERLKDNNFEEAKKLLNECSENIQIAHMAQTKLLQQESNGIESTVQLLMVHAQDHLMDAMVVRDIVEQMIEIQKKNFDLICGEGVEK